MLAVSCIVAFFLAIFGISVIKKFGLKYIQKLSQPIRNDLIIDHSSKKNILPFGGIAIILASLIATSILLITNYFVFDIPPSSTVIISFVTIICVFVLGFIDDFAKVTKRNNIGISGKIRFLIEFVIGLVFSYIVTMTPVKQYDINISIPVPFYGVILLHFNSWFYILFKAFVFTACINAFNITDGLDGLAGTQFLQFAFAFLIIFLIQVVIGAKIGSGGVSVIYLLTIFSFAILGFLCFNSNPATIFMGDGGSMMLGSIVGIVSILCNFELSLIFLCIIPFIETLSVILQVLSFKLRNGKRIFKISPIHHHFEALGFKEQKIVMNFLIVSIFCSSIFIGTIFLK